MLLFNLIKVTIRNIKKDKVYSYSNIAGLSIGISCSLFILMYVYNELSYDRYHKNAKNIYRIVTVITEPDNAFTWAVAQIPLAEELINNYSEIKNAVRFFEAGSGMFKNNEKKFQEDKFYLVDSTVFEMFSYDFIAGNPASALNMPYSIVLTESVAKKYFDDLSIALGSSIQNQYNEEFKITGIIKDVPYNSHFRFDALISKSTMPALIGGWTSFGVYTYIQVQDGYDIKRLSEILDNIIKVKAQPEFEKVQSKIKYQLQPILDIYLHSKVDDEAEKGGDVSYVYIFSSIGLFLLLMSSINYTNLTITRSLQRAKEIGLRKVLGSQRSELFKQFIVESFVITVIALLISLVIIAVFLPAFNGMANKQIPITYLLDKWVIVGLAFIVFFITWVGGSYPALYLSRLNPVQALKSKVNFKKNTISLSSFLILIQFTISVFMIIVTLLVYNQMEYIRDKDLGFDKNNTVRLEVNQIDLREKIQFLVQRLKQLPEIENVGFANSSPGKRIGKLMFSIEDNENKLVERGVDLFVADFNFIKTMGIEIVSGRDFSHASPSDTLYAVIVNQAMVKRMAWENPIGKRMFLKNVQGNVIEKQVIGVIEDYHQNSLYNPIEPLMIVLGPSVQYVFVRISALSVEESIRAIKVVWDEVFPNTAFDYVFLDQDFLTQYHDDEKRQKLLTLFAIITVIIACLGLLGLAAFTTHQRMQEIAIRKINGATISNLIILLVKNFLILMAASIAMAIPLSFYFIEEWLQNFAYRVNLNEQWPVYFISVFLAFVMIAVSLGYYVIKAAMANPIDALRNE
jgi:putative ABC transport system permease protein